MAERPRLLLMPSLTELEWTIRPLLEEWADVASYDAPGVGEEPLIEGSPFQALTRDRPEAVRALALGHPIVSFDLTSERRSLNGAVVDAHVQLAEASHRAFVLEQFRTWVGMRGDPAPVADPLADEFLARVPHAVATDLYGDVRKNGEAYAAELQAARAELPPLPKLLVRHEGCLMFTREGFEDAAAAMPGAETTSTHAKPSVDPAFADTLRAFVERLPG